MQLSMHDLYLYTPNDIVHVVAIEGLCAVGRESHRDHPVSNVYTSHKAHHGNDKQRLKNEENERAIRDCKRT